MFEHKPVLYQKTIDVLHVKSSGVYVDATLGGATHALGVASLLDERGIFIGIDQDSSTLEHGRQRLSHVKCRVELVHANFRSLGVVLDKLGQPTVDGILMDIGVSSPQLDKAERGFSYRQDGPLDMRMDQGSGVTLSTWLDQVDEAALRQVLWDFGEERYARRIARGILAARPIHSTLELADIVRQSVPYSYERDKHPARRTFQALRIAINDELGALEMGLQEAVKRLNPSGVVAVITFHSLEDRFVKTLFNTLSKSCVCPPKQPICTCGGQAFYEKMNNKPITPSDEEQMENPRSRSAKLRALRRMEV